MKLNQVVAIEKPLKQRTDVALIAILKALQKPDLFDGHYKKYITIAEGGETFPPDSKHVQHNVADDLADAQHLLVELFDITAQKDLANCNARASVIVDGETLVADVPATFLMFLEKQLTELNTLVGHAPVLDPAETWTEDAGSGLYKSEIRKTIKTAKVQEALVLYPHSDKHPAQTQMIAVDKIVGNWEAQRISGAMIASDKKLILERIQKLLKAVKCAREEANSTQAPERPVGEKILDWVFAP